MRPMRTISFVNQKGGTGKSVLAINLALAAEKAGEKVCLIDLDPQGTVINWFDGRTAETPAVIDHEKAAKLQQVLRTVAANGYTLTIIDTKGEDSHGTRGAMQAADLCLIPIRPAGPDLHASRATMDALRAMDVDFALIVNQATPNKTARLTTTVMTNLAANGPVLPIAIASRMDFQYAYALGLGVIEHAPDSKASEEIRDAWAWCHKRMNKRSEASHGPQRRRA